MKTLFTKITIITAAVGLFVLSGCSSVQFTSKIEGYTAAGDYQTALTTIEKGKTYYKGANSLLYYLDRGSLLQRVGDFKTSNQELDQADQLIEEFTVTSVSQAAASFLVNDMTMDYSGEDFEKVMVNAVKALNFLYDGDYQGAGIEARKVNTRLLEISDKYDGQAVYPEDAFARYLAAFSHEALKDYNSAYIDYKKAFKAFNYYNQKFNMPIPPMIKDDLVRLSRWLGFDDEYSRWKKEFAEEFREPSRRPQKQSELMIVIYDGLIPSKRTKYVEAPIRTPDNKPYILKVAFPDFKPREPVIEKVRVGTQAGTVYESQVCEPLSLIAYKNLEQRLGLISVKAIARATAKYIAAYQVRKATKSKDEGLNLLVGMATNIYTAATEQADTRSWRTLPNRFHIIRMPLEPGTHKLEIRVDGLYDGPRSGYPLTVELKKGQKKVVPLYLPH